MSMHNLKKVFFGAGLLFVNTLIFIIFFKICENYGFYDKHSIISLIVVILWPIMSIKIMLEKLAEEDFSNTPSAIKHEEVNFLYQSTRRLSFSETMRHLEGILVKKEGAYYLPTRDVIYLDNGNLGGLIDSLMWDVENSSSSDKKALYEKILKQVSMADAFSENFIKKYVGRRHPVVKAIALENYSIR